MSAPNAHLQTSDPGIALVKCFESFCASIYRCPAGKPTFRNRMSVTDLRVSSNQPPMQPMTPSTAIDNPRWCPFCNPEPQRVFLRSRNVYALWDGFPVTDGLALIVPYRHVPTWFDAADTERAELFSAIDAVCSIIRGRGGTLRRSVAPRRFLAAANRRLSGSHRSGRTAAPDRSAHDPRRG
ncbi:MAG: HIT domain-containing protein [Rhodanobacteraceae bacterium]|nr:HIT domain-containing protein [Rhodanobacteraceae bacterium]